MPRVAALRDRLERGILERIDDTPRQRLDRRQRLPNTTNIGFARLEAEAILLLLSEQGVCASAGAACSSGSLEPSHVLRAMRIDDKIAHGAIRFSLSRYTTDAEMDRALEVLPGVIRRLRRCCRWGRETVGPRPRANPNAWHAGTARAGCGRGRWPTRRRCRRASR